MKLPMKGQLYRALLKARGKRVTDTDVRYSPMNYSISKIARELGITSGTINRWSKRWFNDDIKPRKGLDVMHIAFIK